ncbi:hypothetical protein LOAG_08034 [Loa loa]|uniref:Uncharacterized protein n=1 Tax=Loa loa TaxID=7209 RepID=A0A1S0TUK6_LOALO|nr:hypothetical protein LOAG_08034 [Loa loa]EFO20458.1 hypothetical protein LOAG_08034 [Loa loa]
MVLWSWQRLYASSDLISYTQLTVQRNKFVLNVILEEVALNLVFVVVFARTYIHSVFIVLVIFDDSSWSFMELKQFRFSSHEGLRTVDNLGITWWRFISKYEFIRARKVEHMLIIGNNAQILSVADLDEFLLFVKG